MKCLVINVATATDRMRAMTAQLDRIGLTFQRMDAFTPAILCEAEAGYDWDSWERPLKDTEKACFLSHVAAWQHIADQAAPMLILEDDALLAKHTAEVLDAMRLLTDVEHVSLEARMRKKIISRQGVPLGEHHKLLRLYQDRTGAAAYVLWPSGARKLLARAKSQVALADALICKSYDMNSYQIEPACAVQLDRARIYGIDTEVETQSMIDVGQAVASQKHGIFFRLRRLSSQVRMGLRALRCFWGAERRLIDVDPQDFKTH